MTTGTFNGVRLFYEDTGSGDPMVLVHGSWADHALWGPIVPMLAQRFRVVSYDRRGHSESERPETQGSPDEDADDLAALIEELDLAPAHVVANSQGAVISLRLAAKRPELFRSLSAHEPPLFAALENVPEMAEMMLDLEAIGRVIAKIQGGDPAGGAREFVDTVVGPGFWQMLPEEGKQTFARNAPTFLDEVRGEGVKMADLAPLGETIVPILMSRGTEGPPFFAAVVKRLIAAIPSAKEHTFEGAGHVPHMTHPQPYVDAVTAFVVEATG
jgi:pimeloyl-ACP methyl ester carboxylesterase